jgi:outer membrane immunogenic protein
MIVNLIRGRAMLRRIFLATAALASAASPGFSGEKAEMSRNWEGFYSGMSVGGGFGSPPVCTIASNVFFNTGFFQTGGAPLASALSQSGCAPVETGGAIGGGQTGYNLRLNDDVIVGGEAEINGLSQSGHASFEKPTPDFAGSSTYASTLSEKSVNWFGALRGRIGWLAMSNVLLHATAGLSFGGLRGFTDPLASGTSPAGFAWYGLSGVPTLCTPFWHGVGVGWTAGGGAEWMFLPQLSLKLEYLFYDLGPARWINSPQSAFMGGSLLARNASTSSTRFTGNIVRVGVNFHFE